MQFNLFAGMFKPTFNLLFLKSLNLSWRLVQMFWSTIAISSKVQGKSLWFIVLCNWIAWVYNKIWEGVHFLLTLWTSTNDTSNSVFFKQVVSGFTQWIKILIFLAWIVGIMGISIQIVPCIKLYKGRCNMDLY